jgi:predicted RNase H-like HicB family nuclease
MAYLDVRQQYIITMPPAREGGRYIIAFPEYPGCITDGATLDEAMQRAGDLLEQFFDSDEPLLASLRRPSYPAHC